MANTTYQVTLSLDGAHTISVTSDEPAAMKTAVAWAKATYDALVEHDRKASTAAAADRTTDDEAGAEVAPTCAVHHKAMVRVQGKRGPFWSCHERTEDGRFCSYRPPQA